MTVFEVETPNIPVEANAALVAQALADIAEGGSGVNELGEALADIGVVDNNGEPESAEKVHVSGNQAYMTIAGTTYLIQVCELWNPMPFLPSWVDTRRSAITVDGTVIPIN